MSKDILLTKGEFAKEINVSAPRVSQYINDGKIYGKAIVGEGRRAQINLEVARDQLKNTLDLSQSMGNGLKNQVNAASVDLSNYKSDLSGVSTRNSQERRAKALADQEEIKLKRMKEQDALDSGKYMLAAEARNLVPQAIHTVFLTVDEFIRSAATDLASDHSLDRKAIEVTLREKWRETRTTASESQSALRSAEEEVLKEVDK